MDAEKKIAENLRRARETEIQTALRVRAGGRRRYVIGTGLVRIGITLGLIAFALTLVVAPSWTPIRIGIPMAPWISRLILLLPLGMLAGSLWSVRLWRQFERVWFPLLPPEPRSK